MGGKSYIMHDGKLWEYPEFLEYVESLEIIASIANDVLRGRLAWHSPHKRKVVSEELEATLKWGKEGRQKK